MDTKQAAAKWNVSERRVRLLCAQGRIPGAVREGKSWTIPDTASKPVDERGKKTHSLLGEIGGLKAVLDSKRPLTEGELERLRNDFAVSYTHDSTAIEGNTLTLRETALVLNGATVAGKPLKEHLEATGHRDAFLYLCNLVSEKAPLTERLIKEVHSLVLIDKPQDRGVYRRIEVRVGGSAKSRPSPFLIEKLMGDLLSDFASSNGDLLSKLAKFHLDFEGIHPFVDGNGRTGRLLLNFELMKAGYPPIDIKYSDRSAYYSAFETYGSKKDIDPMKRIIGRCLIESLNALIAAIGD